MILYHALPDTPGLNHKDSILEVMCKIFSYYGERLSFFESCITSRNDIEDLHGFRVSIRYLKVITRIFSAYVPLNTLDFMRAALQSGGKATNPLRDLDVFNEQYLNGDVKNHRWPISDNFQAYLAMEYELRRKPLITYLESLEYLNLKEVNNKIGAGKGIIVDKHTIESKSEFIKRAVIERLHKVNITNQSLELLEYKDIHKLRIKIKRLRYSIEIFKDLLLDDGDNLLWNLKDLQTSLGNYCDNFMAGQLVQEYIDNSGKMVDADYGLLEKITVQERNHIFGEVIRSWEDFKGMDYQEEVEKTLLPCVD